jgi:hypothetical protein
MPNGRRKCYVGIGHREPPTGLRWQVPVGGVMASGRCAEQNAPGR